MHAKGHPVELDPLRAPRRPRARARTAFAGRLRPDCAFGVRCRCRRGPIAELGPHPPVRQAAVGRDVEGRRACRRTTRRRSAWSCRASPPCRSGNAMPSATWRTEPSGVTRAMIPGANSPRPHEVEADAVDVGVAAAVHDDLVPAVVGDRPLRSAWVTIDPSGSLRSQPLCPVDRAGGRRAASRSTNGEAVPDRGPRPRCCPRRSTATISCVPQWANHRRSSCQRGDSPITRPGQTRTCASSHACFHAATLRPPCEFEN